MNEKQVLKIARKNLTPDSYLDDEVLAFAAALEKEWFGTPVAYVVQSITDGSIGMNIAPTHYLTFKRLYEKLELDPWIIKGLARISPLFTAPNAAATQEKESPQAPVDSSLELHPQARSTVPPAPAAAMPDYDPLEVRGLYDDPKSPYYQPNTAATQETTDAQGAPPRSASPAPAAAPLCDKILADMPPYYGESLPPAAAQDRVWNAIIPRARRMLEIVHEVDDAERKHFGYDRTLSHYEQHWYQAFVAALEKEWFRKPAGFILTTKILGPFIQTVERATLPGYCLAPEERLISNIPLYTAPNAVATQVPAQGQSPEPNEVQHPQPAPAAAPLCDKILADMPPYYGESLSPTAAQDRRKGERGHPTRSENENT